MFQPADQGALPTLDTATSPPAKGGGYNGPRGLRGFRGLPTAAEIPANAQETQSCQLVERVGATGSGEFGPKNTCIPEFAIHAA